MSILLGLRVKPPHLSSPSDQKTDYQIPLLFRLLDIRCMGELIVKPGLYGQAFLFNVHRGFRPVIIKRQRSS